MEDEVFDVALFKNEGGNPFEGGARAIMFGAQLAERKGARLKEIWTNSEFDQQLSFDLGNHFFGL